MNVQSLPVRCEVVNRRVREVAGGYYADVGVKPRVSAC